MIEKDKDIYEKFVSDNLDTLPLFYQPVWLNLVANTDWAALSYILKNEIVAVLPYCKVTKFGLNGIVMPMLTPYQGIWFCKSVRPIDQEKIAKELIQQLPKVFYYNVALHPSQQTLAPWEKLGFYKKIRYTHVITKNQIEQIKEQFTPTTKAHIRSAEKKLSVITNDDATALYENIESSFQKYGNNNRTSLSSIQKIMNCQSVSPTLYHAVDESDKVQASVLTVEDNHTVYHLLSGRKTEAFRGAVALIVQKALSDAMLKNKNYDFEGSSIAGIATFFKGFGSKQLTFWQFYKTKTRITDLLLKAIGKF